MSGGEAGGNPAGGKEELRGRRRAAVEQALQESIEVKRDTLASLAPQVAEAAGMAAEALSAGGKLLICGNGGSAADAQHMACELVVRFAREGRALPALALSTDTSVLTARANDHEFDSVFSRQVEALGRPGDLLLAISTSGNSPNITQAAKRAGEWGLKVVGLTGEGGGELAGLCDICLKVPSSSTPRIQEAHIAIIHAICAIIEDELR